MLVIVVITRDNRIDADICMCSLLLMLYGLIHSTCIYMYFVCTPCYVSALMCLHASFDITVTSPLNPAIFDESCSTAGVAAESRKHVANDPKCFELRWTCAV